MKVHVLKAGLQVMGLGGLPVGWVGDLHDSVAKEYMRHGAVEPYETKVIRENPSPAAGETQSSSASQAAPASPSQTRKPSKRGGKKKKTDDS